MKVTYLVTGSGGSFYCGNCHRDMLYVSSIKHSGGIDISAIPLYLPPINEEYGEEFENPVFFGAISIYLRDKIKMFEHLPAFFDKILDAPPLLRLAAKKAGTTRTEGLEETTIAMIKGNDPSRDREIARLSKHICSSGKSDIIHLSNALIIGLASQLKKSCTVSIVCSLQNEDDWIEEMREPYRSEAWRLIGEESVNVDRFVAPSQYFKDFVVARTGISPGKIDVVPSGLDATRSAVPQKNGLPPAIGYFSRLSHQNGLDKLVDAFIMIRNKNKIPGLQLHLCGGYTADNKHFIKEQFRKIKESNLDGDVKIYSSFHGKHKDEFFDSIDLMSVPVRKHDAYGLYLLEAAAAGVPVVQPATGAFPEIIANTGGGLTYMPDTAETLADTIVGMMADRSGIRELGISGFNAINNSLSTGEMAKHLLNVYRRAME